MADTNANVNFNVDTSQALAEIKNLQRTISGLYREMSKGSAAAQAATAGYQQNLINNINATGQFTAKLATIRTTTESFTNALEKNKLSLGQYFRYGTAASKNFGTTFKTEFATIDKVARERVKDLQTQYIKMGRDASGAMKAIAVRPTTLDLKNLGTQTAIAAQKQQIFNQLIKQGSTNLLNWGKNTQWAGRQLMVGFTIPLALFATQAGRSFMQLEEQAIKFKRVYGDLFTTGAQTDKALAEMRELATEFTKFGIAVEETVGLASTVAQMGKTGAELTAQVTEATRLSVLGGMSQEEALNTTIGLTNAFGVSVEDLGNKVNFLNAAENQTILSIQDFNEAVPRAGSVVAQLGGGVEDLAFFLTAMREGGVEASQGANALKSSLGRLINPTQRAQDALKGYGIDVTGIVEKNTGNLRATILELGYALDTLEPLEKARAIETLFGKFQFARMSTLFQNIIADGSQAATVLELIGSNTSDLATIADRELGRVEESAATKFTAAIAKFQAALAPIGEEFLRLATPIIEFGTNLLEKFNNLGDGGRKAFVLILGVIGGVAPVLLMVIGLVANLVANFIKGGAAIAQFFQRFRNSSQNLAEQTNYLSTEQLEASSVAASLNQTHQTLIQTYTGEVSALARLTAAYSNMINKMREFRGPIVTQGGMMKPPGFMKGRKVPGYKDGVVEVPGPKGKGDIMPAMLAPGEAVIPAEMAKKYGPLINAMIAGNIPGYATGKLAVPGGGSYNVDLFRAKDEAVIQLAINNFAQNIEGGSEIIEAALKRSAGDLRQTIKTFTKELAFQANARGIPVGETFAAAGRPAPKQNISASQARGTSLEQLEGKFGAKGVEEYERATAASKAGIQAATDYYIETGHTVEEATQMANKLQAQIDRAHIVPVGQLEKLYDSAWDPDMWVAQAAFENQLSNTMQQSPKTQEKYLQVLASQNITEEQKAALHDKITNNLALTEQELEIQARILREMLQDTEFMQTAPPQFAVRARAVSAASDARVAMGPASAGVGDRTASQTAAAQARVQQEMNRSAVAIIDSAERGFVEGARTSLDTASPSREAYRQGQMGGEGYIAGLAEKVDDARAVGSQIGTASLMGQQVPQYPGFVPFQQPGVADQPVAAASSRLAEKFNSMSGKVTASSFALSGLVGTAMMFDGAIGDVAQKMFPFVSAITGVTMALSMLQGTTVATTVSTRARAASEAFSTAANIGAGGVVAKLGGFFKGLSAAASALLSPLGLMIVGVTVLAAGIFALYKIAENERNKLEALGDAAKLSADQLNALAGAGIELRTSGFAQAPELTQISGREVDPGTVQQLRESQDFLDSYASTIESLKDASVAQGERMIANIAVQIRALGGTEEQVADVIAALQQEAGRTDLSLDFGAIDISSANVRQERIADIAESAQQYQGQISSAGSRAGLGPSEVTQQSMQNLNLGGREAASSAALLAGDISSTIVALESLRQEGTMSVQEVQDEFRNLSGVISSMESPGAQFEVFDQVLENLNLDGTLGGIEDIGMAMALVEQQLLGLEISSEDVSLFEAASEEGATAEMRRFAAMRMQSIKGETAALAERKAIKEAEAEAERVRDTDIDAGLAAMDAEIQKLEEQSGAYEALIAAGYSEADAKALSGNAAYARAIAAAAETDAINGTTEASDELLAKINALREAGNLPGIKTEGSGGGGGGKVDTSPFDDITKKLRLFNGAQVSVTSGFKDTIAEIERFTSVSGQLGGEFNGLNKQLRGLGLNENLIEMIAGMDPDEYEKRKNQLFIFDDQGTITGMTGKLQSLNQALNTATIGEFINEQQNITVSVGNQINALSRLTSAGASYQAAYRAVQNTALAAAISTAQSSAEIQAAAEAAMQAQEMMAKFEKINEEEQRKKNIADAVKQQNKEFANQAKVLDYINKNRSKLTEAQIEAILSDKDLQALLLEPSISPRALQKALDNANKQAELELKIKKLTVSGQQEIFEEGFSNAMEAFDTQENQIEIDFKVKMSKDQSIIDQAEEEIAKLEFSLDDYEAGLEEIERQEEVINDAYEKRFEALDKVAEANEKITRQQQSQLDIADALSRGDIAAAAKAAQEARAAAASAAIEDERARLERAQASQVAGLTSRGGMTREDLESRISNIQEKIFRIEEDRLEPAEEAMRLAELQKEKDIESLQVLGKTKEQWEAISQRIDNARINNYAFVESMKEALDIVEKLVEELGKPKPVAKAAPAPAPRSSGGGGGGGGGKAAPAPAPAPPRPVAKKDIPGVTRAMTVPEMKTALTKATDPYTKAMLGKSIYMSQPKSGTMRAAMGGFVRKAMSGPPAQFAQGGLVSNFLTTMADGGFAMGSDNIPAMLTPGEFVVRRPAVSNFGVENLEKINRGENIGGSVYNYNLNVNVKSDSNPDKIARTVMSSIRQVENKRIRGNRF